MKQYKEWKSKMAVKSFVAIGGAVVIGLTALTILGGSWYTVDQGERGVMLRNGAITGVSEPGLGFKLPIIDRVVDIDVRHDQASIRRVAVAPHLFEECLAGKDLTRQPALQCGYQGAVKPDHGPHARRYAREPRGPGQDQRVHPALQHRFQRQPTVPGKLPYHP